MSGPIRRRGADLEAAIFAAVFGQLVEVGYRRLTMEGVAAAAHTGKAALYRRWSSKEELIGDALRHELPPPPEPPRAGTLRGDLLELLGRFRDALGTCNGAAFRVLKEDSDGVGVMHDVVHGRLIRPVKDLLYETLRAGAERGDVRPGAATRDMADVGPAMVVYRYMTRGEIMDDDGLVFVVDEIVLRAVAAPDAAVSRP
ncbi:TetR-like C-terminal domain-containing protein [Actinomadura atramentaria]|uniref:TetR-like C-terminal domain-containing protein n=1 Tax=Actinomadura atramentaria TaxID=1990 RepID=UPI00038205E3|nr:TetR-like C-terminal domain-containing protein [Actinomadura atramentaria]